MSRRAKLHQTERYDLEQSPFAQNPTQREVALLLGESRDDLRCLATYKESGNFIVRRQIKTGSAGKVRDLAYPVSRLRKVHEILKFHLNKIKQPSYLFSPRKGRGQRDNAMVHLDQEQYLTLDLKQFYPSTTDGMVRRWLRDELGMYPDVAGLLTNICTVDGKVSFGSPVTPVLCTLIHRRMFDQIAELCRARGLRYSVWVDDLTISGAFVPGEVLNKIREIVASFGLKSHKIEFRNGNKPVFITGIGVVGPHLVASNSINMKIRDAWCAYHDAQTDDERDFATQRLLSLLGTVRQICGPKSEKGRKAADEMNSLRQKRVKRYKAAQDAEVAVSERKKSSDAEAGVPAPF